MTDGAFHHALASRAGRFRAANALSTSKFSREGNGATPRRYAVMLTAQAENSEGQSFPFAWGVLATRALKSLAGCGSVFNVLPAPSGYASRVEHAA